MTILVCHSDGLYACISIAGKCTVLWQHSLELGGLLTHCFPHINKRGSFWDEVFCNVLRYPCADVCLTCVRGAYCWSCARVDINKSDFIMLLTGCDYMFRSLLLSMTVDVLASTAKDDVKIKKKGSVNSSSCYLSSPPALLPLEPPHNIPLTPLFSSEPCGGCVIYGLCDIEIYLTLSLFTSLFFGSEFSSSQHLLQTCDRSNWAKALCETIQNPPLSWR